MNKTKKDESRLNEINERLRTEIGTADEREKLKLERNEILRRAGLLLDDDNDERRDELPEPDPGEGHRFGTCHYCGQVTALEESFATLAAADISAAETCDCFSARNEKRIKKQIAAAKERVEQIFGKDAESVGFVPIDAKATIELFNELVELTARGYITSTTVNVRGRCKAKISYTSKEKIKVERSETRSCQLEE
jgi:hypothetical protein